MNVVLDNETQRDFTNDSREIREEDLTKSEFKSEINDAIQIGYFCSNLVHRNRDLIRRIRKTLDDRGLDTLRKAANRHDLLGKKIIRSIWDEEIATRGIEILTNTRKCAYQSQNQHFNADQIN